MSGKRHSGAWPGNRFLLHRISNPLNGPVVQFLHWPPKFTIVRTHRDSECYPATASRFSGPSRPSFGPSDERTWKYILRSIFIPLPPPIQAMPTSRQSFSPATDCIEPSCLCTACPHLGNSFDNSIASPPSVPTLRQLPESLHLCIL